MLLNSQMFITFKSKDRKKCVISCERNIPSVSFENVRWKPIHFSNFRTINEVSHLGVVSDLTFSVDFFE